MEYTAKDLERIILQDGWYFVKQKGSNSSYPFERRHIMKLIYPAVFTPFGDSDGFTVEVPDLPGCVTEGDSLVEAIEMGTDAASGWILGEIEDGNSFPAASASSELEVPDGSFVSLLVLDMVAYAERYGNRAVRRNITIPAWLDTFVQKNNLSLSKVVQDSLLNLAQKESHK